MNLPDDFSWTAFDRYYGDDERPERDPLDEPDDIDVEREEFWA